MKVVVIGATGNVGSATVRALAADARIDSILGVARRLPQPAFPMRPAGTPLDRPTADKISWRAADISSDSLDFVAGADAVISLAWRIQPQHDEPTLRRTNVLGTKRVLDAVVANGVPSLVYASSVGTYAAGSKRPPADESWPATGIPSSVYSRHKAEVEAVLDAAEAKHAGLRITRLRTSLVFQRAAASQVHRLFFGRFAPWHVPRWARVLPSDQRLTFQATHADDIADAYVRAVLGAGSGPFNIAADPVLSPDVIADAVGGRVLPIPLAAVRAAAMVTYRAHLQPSEAGWLDMATQTPLMDTTRARTQLGWSPTRTAVEALQELFAGMGDGAGAASRPLHPRHSPAE